MKKKHDREGIILCVLMVLAPLVAAAVATFAPSLAYPLIIAAGIGACAYFALSK